MKEDHVFVLALIITPLIFYNFITVGDLGMSIFLATVFTLFFPTWIVYGLLNLILSYLFGKDFIIRENISSQQSRQIPTNRDKGVKNKLVNNSLKSEDTTSENYLSIVSKISKPEALSPDKKYIIPRKIDWEEIGKNNRRIGIKGEEIVMEIERKYLKSIGRFDLAQKVSHVSLVYGDGLGYDVGSYFEDGTIKYIEVKTTTTANTNSFYISPNEIAFLSKNQETAFLYRVSNIDDLDRVALKTFSAKDVINSDMVPTQYLVKLN